MEALKQQMGTIHALDNALRNLTEVFKLPMDRAFAGSSEKKRRFSFLPWKK